MACTHGYAGTVSGGIGRMEDTMINPNIGCTIALILIVLIVVGACMIRSSQLSRMEEQEGGE